MIAFEASGLMTAQPTGVATYGRALLSALRKLSGDAAAGRERWRLIYPAGRWRRRGLLADTGLRTQPYFSGRALQRRCSLVHLLDTRFPRSYRGPLVATIFDTIAALPVSREQELSSERFRQKKLRAYEAIAKRADVVVTLSDAVRQEILKRFPAARRVEVIPPGVSAPVNVDSEVADVRALTPFGIRKPFLLALGALCPRKNLEAVVGAFDRTRREETALQLVLMGGPDYGWHGSVGEAAVEACHGSVILTGYATREVVWAALRQAACLLQLSHYEGYGLTALEGMAVSTPVIASRRGGLAEAVGDAGWLVEPDDAEAVQAALVRVLADKDEARAKVRKGRERAAFYSWERAARAICDLHASLTGISL